MEIVIALIWFIIRLLGGFKKKNGGGFMNM